jgi:hypothetical protein
MQIPIWSNLQELDRGPRKFLLFATFNVTSWQSLVGPAMILLARHIDMPPAWVGFLISFMPLSMLLVVVNVPLVTRFGPKKVMFTAWLLRYIAISSVFTMPWAMAKWGPEAGWYVLIGAVLGFCLMRAIGAGGWFPWLHEVVPGPQRGAFFSTETGIVQLVTVAVIGLQALLLFGDPGVEQYLLIYCMGIVTGLASLFWMMRIPGGGGLPGGASIRDSVASYRAPLGNRPFLAFVLTATGCLSAVSWLNAAVVMYMRDALGLP